VFDEYVERCIALQLSPFLGQVSGRPVWDKKLNRNTLLMMITIDGYRSFAQRTKLYGGQGPTLWTRDRKSWYEVWGSTEHPMAAKASVFRKDWKQPVSAVATTLEFRPKSPGPGSMWLLGGGAHMLGIRAESNAFRKAFPREMLYQAVPELLGDEDFGDAPEDPETLTGPANPGIDPSEKMRVAARTCIELFDAEGVTVELLSAYLKGDPFAMNTGHLDHLRQVYKHVRELNRDQPDRGTAWFGELLKKRGIDAPKESEPEQPKSWGPVKCPDCGREWDRVKFEREGCEHCIIERARESHEQACLKDLGSATPSDSEPVASGDIVEGRDIIDEPERPEGLREREVTEHDLNSEAGLRPVTGQLPDPAQNYDEDIPWGPFMGSEEGREPGEDG